MSNLQTTIKQETSLTGVGLHTGKNVSLRFAPAPANTGYVFVRYDLEGVHTLKLMFNGLPIPNGGLI